MMIRPPFTEQDAIQMMYDLYGLTVIASELPSEIDRNFKVTDANGTSYVLKIAHSSRTFDVLDLQNQAILHLSDKVDFCPSIIPSHSGELMPTYNDHHIRLMSYLEGTVLGEFKPHTGSLLSHIGTQLGQLSTALSSFDHHAHRTDYQWNILNIPNIVKQMIQYIPDEKQSIIRHFSDHYATIVEPQLADLRSGFIHSDANDYNLLVQATDFDTVHMTGLIDFGDMVYSPIIAELAIALAYIMMGKDDPLAAAVPVIRGYHDHFPLQDRELETLFAFITARLCMSVCIGAFQQQREPDNDYLAISKQGAWRLLEQLQGIHPNLAHYVFRDACGLTPVPHEPHIVNWLKNTDIHPILGQQITDFTVFDLSVGSTEIGNLPDIQHTPTFTRMLFDRLNQTKIGIGRYNEPRLLYFGDTFESTETERRTIHIGIDLFQTAGTPIYAPLDGTIYSVHDNAGYKDYGPTIILEHKTDENIPFYTLYGHLSRESLKILVGASEAHPMGRPELEVGKIINKGDKLAEMGDYPINGDWPPHLHFQIITDMLGMTGDFPGVAPNSQRNVWLSISPDPNIITKIDAQTAVQHKTTHDDLLDLRRTFLNPSLSISYKKHLKIERGYMQHLYDENGRAYLDCVNNVPHVGHSNPRVVKAAQRQMAVLNTNTRYLHDTIIEYAQKLADTFPRPLECLLSSMFRQ